MPGFLCPLEIPKRPAQPIRFAPLCSHSPFAHSASSAAAGPAIAPEQARNAHRRDAQGAGKGSLCQTQPVQCCAGAVARMNRWPAVGGALHERVPGGAGLRRHHAQHHRARLLRGAPQVVGTLHAQPDFRKYKGHPR